MRPENPVDRRLYFRYLARETVTWFEEFRGKPNRQLSELPELSDEAIAALIRGFAPASRLCPVTGASRRGWRERARWSSCSNQ